MKLHSFLPLGAASVVIAASGQLNAAVSLVTIGNVITNSASGAGDGNGGRLSEFTGGTTGLTKVDPNNVATWTHGNTWQEGWQGGRQTGGTNLGWVVLDFNTSTTGLENLHLWNVKEFGASPTADPQERGVQTFNIWYSNTPTVTPASGNYNFSSGGWTQLGGTNTLAQGGATGVLNGTISLSGISSARYVAIEILTNYGSGTGGVDTTNRIGLAEVVVTRVVPEPGTALLGAIAGLGLLRRRRVS